MKQCLHGKCKPIILSSNGKHLFTRVIINHVELRAFLSIKTLWPRYSAAMEDHLTPSLTTISIFSAFAERAVLLWPFGRKPHLFVSYPINIYKATEAFIASMLRARDVSWHHYALNDWWKHSGCISCSATLEENGVVIKRYDSTHGCSFLIGTIWNIVLHTE